MRAPLTVQRAVIEISNRKSTDLSINIRTSEEAIALANAIQQHKPLNISRIHIIVQSSACDVTEVFKALHSEPSIKTLKVHAPFLDNKDLCELVNLIITLKLESLLLHCNISKFHLTAIEEIIIAKRSISELSLTGEIGLDGAQMIARILQKSRVQSLEFYSSRVGEVEGLTIIRDALRSSNVSKLLIDTVLWRQRSAGNKDTKIESLIDEMNGIVRSNSRLAIGENTERLNSQTSSRNSRSCCIIQ